jgi:hypothetical protein
MWLLNPSGEFAVGDALGVVIKHFESDRESQPLSVLLINHQSLA